MSELDDINDTVNDTDDLASDLQKRSFDFPAREPWSSAAVKLLKGVVYHDAPGNIWDTILTNVSPLTDHFGRLGLVLIVDEYDGMAWLHQPEADELPADFESIPKLFYTAQLSFDATLLCMMLRDELLRSEEDLQNERCVVGQSVLLETWQMFFPEETDAKRLDDGLSKQLGKLAELKYVKRFEKVPPSWEIRKILKARLPLETLKAVRAELEAELQRRHGGKK